jgi:hypothetical protein
LVKKGRVGPAFASFALMNLLCCCDNLDEERMFGLRRSEWMGCLGFSVELLLFSWWYEESKLPSSGIFGFVMRETLSLILLKRTF